MPDVREALLALGLILAGALVVAGVDMLHRPAAVILSGLIVGGFTLLFLAEAD